MSLDALVYAGIKNNITDQQPLEDLASTLPPYVNSGGLSDKNNAINNILRNTTIKRACCMGLDGDKKGITVRIPIPTAETSSSLGTKFGYYDKLISVPSSLCQTIDGTYAPGASICDDFYQSYCSNLKSLYKLENGGKFNQDEWRQYKPECACYGDLSDINLFVNENPVCYMAGCEPHSSTAYLNTGARNAECRDLVLCLSTVNLSENDVEGNFNSNVEIEQNCGSETSNPTNPTNPTNPAQPTSNTAIGWTVLAIIICCVCISIIVGIIMLMRRK